MKCIINERVRRGAGRDVIPVCVREMDWERNRGMKYHPTRAWSHSAQEEHTLTWGKDTITSQVCASMQACRFVYMVHLPGKSGKVSEITGLERIKRQECLPVCLGSVAPQAALGVLVWKHLSNTRQEEGGEMKLYLFEHRFQKKLGCCIKHQ